MASLSRAPPSASAGASFFSFPGRDLVPGSFGLVPGSAFAFAFAFERTDQRAPLAVCSAPDPPSASAGASFYPSSLDVVGSSRSRPRVAIWFPFLPSPSLAVGHRQIKRRPSTTPRQPPPPSPHLPGPCSVAVAIRSQLSQLAIKPARNFSSSRVASLLKKPKKMLPQAPPAGPCPPPTPTNANALVFILV